MLPDVNGLVEALKRAALEAFEAAKPVNVCFGEVVSISPLKINVEQKMTLGEKQLILTRNVTDFNTTVSVNWTYESGKKKLTIHNGLAVGEKVILLRQQEGQRFIVVDRVGK